MQIPCVGIYDGIVKIEISSRTSIYMQGLLTSDTLSKFQQVEAYSQHFFQFPLFHVKKGSIGLNLFCLSKTR